MQLSIAFSPCPNDTFIFDALVHKKIDTEGIEFLPVLEDVETLNQWALQGKYDISKISYGAYPGLYNDYAILQQGSALGEGVGPLLIRSRQQSGEVEHNTIAIPGRHTTAHFLLTHAYPKAVNKIFMRYDEIESFVQQGKGLGVIIHENRFTYREKGLELIADLGDVWQKATGLPIPLGGIVVKRNIDHRIQRQVDRLIGQSIAYAWSHYPQLNDYIRSHAREMSEEVMRRHIELYVNDFSINMKEEGRRAVQEMMNTLGLEYAADTALFVS